MPDDRFQLPDGRSVPMEAAKAAHAAIQVGHLAMSSGFTILAYGIAGFRGMVATVVVLLLFSAAMLVKAARPMWREIRDRSS